MKKVDVIFVGMPKAGSTWFFKNLISQDGIYVPNCKETNYFNDNYHKGEDWYHSFYEEASKDDIWVEVCHDYIFCEEALGRIINYNSKVKIIAFLREPVDWVISSFLYAKRNGMYSGKSSDYYKSVIQKYKIDYNMLMEKYENNLGEESFKVCAFEEIKKDPENLLKEVFRFMGLNENSMSFKNCGVVVNSAMKPRVKVVNKLLTLASKRLKKAGAYKIIAKVKFNPFVQRVLYKELPVVERNNALKDLMDAKCVDEIKGRIKKIGVVGEFGLYEKWYGEHK